MTNENKQEGEKPSESHRVLWISVSVFIVLAIAAMWFADFYFSPEMINSTTLPDAVGK